MRISRSTDGLMGRVMAVMAGGLLVVLLASIAFYDEIDRFTVREDHARRVAELLVVGGRLAQAAPEAERAQAIAVLSTRHLQVDLRSRPLPDGSATQPSLAALKASIVRWEPALAGRQLHLTTAHARSGGREDLLGTMALPGGDDWLYFRSTNIYERWPLLRQIVLLAAMLTVGVLGCTAILLRMVGTPLRALGAAAHAIGRGRPVVLVESGPRDVRQVAHAFNDMQARIARLLTDRTQALAAVSHDLRTPLARLKLAVDYVEADDIRQMMARDVDDMEMMLASLLAYLRAEQNPEEVRHIDLAALVDSVVSDARDLGGNVRHDAGGPLLIHARPLGLKRALANLVDNAVKYGGEVTVTLARDREVACISVADSGPGISEAALAGVMEPFVRLDESRAHEGASFGLGLPIAQKLVASEGGTLTLVNRPEGGLVATIRLPLDGDQSSSSS